MDLRRASTGYGSRTKKPSSRNKKFNQDFGGYKDFKVRSLYNKDNMGGPRLTFSDHFGVKNKNMGDINEN